MKGVIVSGKQSGWEKELLGVSNRLELPVVNKCLFEYYLDFFNLLGIDEILILQDEYSSKVVDLVDVYKPWFSKIEIKSYDPEKSLENEVSRYQKFLNKEGVFILEASSFILYDKENKNIFDINRKRNHWITSEINNTNFIQCTIGNIKEFYELSICLLEKYQNNYSLSGYRQGNAYFGQNNKVAEGVLSNTLAHIGNDVTVEEEVLAEGINIIGQSVLLSSACRLEETIVLENVLVDKDLDLRKKIITVDKIICPYSGAFFETDEDISLSSKMDFSFSNFIVRYIVGTLVLPLAYLISSVSALFQFGEEVSYINTSGKRKNVRVFNKLDFVDYIIWLGEFSKGNIRLIGETPCQNNKTVPGVVKPFFVFGNDGFSSGHLSYLSNKNSHIHEVSLILGSLR